MSQAWKVREKYDDQTRTPKDPNGLDTWWTISGHITAQVRHPYCKHLQDYQRRAGDQAHEITIPIDTYTYA